MGVGKGGNMIKWILSIVILIVGAVMVIALPYKPKTTITWTAPVTNTDGTPLTNLKGYKIYYSTASGNYTDAQSKDVGNTTSINIEQTVGILDGTYYFAATAYNTAGVESTFSNEVSAVFTRQANAPKSMEIK